MKRTDLEYLNDPELAHLANRKPHQFPTVAQLRKDCVAYLVNLHPDDAEPSGIVEYVEEEFMFFFKSELEQWELDSKYWPTPLTLELFRKWFEIECFDMVLDTGMRPEAQ